MRRIKALALAAVTGISLCGASCSKGGGNPENALSEPVPDIAEEPVFTEYFPEDFRSIRVNFDYQEDEPPLNMTEYEVSIHVTPKMSPCKSDYDTEFVTPDWVYEDITIDEEERQEIIAAYEEQWKKEREQTKRKMGSPYAYVDPWMTYSGGDVYVLVNYDNICSVESHCFDIIRINAETGEQQTAFSYADKEKTINVKDIKAAKGSLYFDGYIGDDFGLFRVDEAANTLVEEHTAELNGMFDSWWMLSSYFDGRLTIQGWCPAETPDQNGGFCLAEYDFAAGEWQIITEADLLNGYTNTMLCYGDKAIKREFDENDKLTCTVDGVFTLHTGVRSARLRTARENMVTVTVSDTVGNNFLYAYDLAKKERYDYDLTGMGTIYGEMYPVRGDAVYMTRTGESFILIPSIGAAFSFGDHTSYYYNGENIVTFDVENSDGEFESYIDPGGGYYRTNHRGSMNENDTKEREQAVKITLIS